MNTSYVTQLTWSEQKYRHKLQYYPLSFVVTIYQIEGLVTYHPHTNRHFSYRVRQVVL